MTLDIGCGQSSCCCSISNYVAVSEVSKVATLEVELVLPGLDRFKKAETLEPFSVSINSAYKPNTQSLSMPASSTSSPHVSNSLAVPDAAPLVGQNQQVTQIGGGNQLGNRLTDWAIEPRAGVYFLEVLKDRVVLDKINLDRRRQIFRRQSVSRQHAAVIPHKNGSIYVIDLGSAHGAFVANERLTKDSPVELEVGQSLRFAASTRIYILRKNEAALFPRPPPKELNLPPPPDPSDEYSVLNLPSKSTKSGSSKGGRDDSHQSERSTKRMKKLRVAFRDQAGGELVEVVGVSDGADVETEPGPLDVKEGSLVGKYEHLIQTTVIPRGKQQSSMKEDTTSQKGVTNKLQEVLNKVKTTSKGGIYDDLYGESFSGKLGSSWAYLSVSSGDRPASTTKDAAQGWTSSVSTSNVDEENDDDLFSQIAFYFIINFISSH
ncbi:hypothetical protein ACB094_05G155900 [Castanea mollissima]